MKRLVLVVLVVLIALVPCSVAWATYPVGYYSQGYTYAADGLWYYPGYTQGYTRTLYQSPGYWSCGVYYPGQSYYQYAAYVPYVAPYVAPAVAAVSYKDPGWRSKLLDIAAQRDKVEGQIRKDAFEQQYYLQSLQALGLQGNFTWQGYGQSPVYPSVLPALGVGYGQSYTGHAYQSLQYGANATTQYGYSTLAQLYGANDLNSLYQQAAQNTQFALKLGGDANAGLQSLAGQEGTNRAKVAEILAKGQMAAQIMAAMQVTPTSETKGYTFKIEPKSLRMEKVEVDVDPDNKVSLQRQLQQVIGENCASCHSGKNVKGGLDLAGYLTFSQADKDRVWARIAMQPSHPDYEKRMMPRDLRDESRPGVPLTLQKQRVFFLN